MNSSNQTPEIRVHLDTSPKKFVGNKPYYFTNRASRESFSVAKSTRHMTYNQACTFARNMRDVGIPIADSWRVLGVSSAVHPDCPEGQFYMAMRAGNTVMVGKDTAHYDKDEGRVYFTHTDNTEGMGHSVAADLNNEAEMHRAWIHWTGFYEEK